MTIYKNVRQKTNPHKCLYQFSLKPLISSSKKEEVNEVSKEKQIIEKHKKVKIRK